ncbi:CobW family GTP-binding protein [Marinobacterium rhizophilum]|uniref:GTP-binding protein n=1 Tax=Marinobacterium rhizophilum TaxID=420402 RepID=A0ABY5HE19_9GAMM|nr:GTP-binding protein [Marinobacterium rhizophilum]UTW10525.1 GTP-binding protein [Marinobacterium rhizophilum]
MPIAEKVPLTVISGFLGAGKTSWLNRQIRAGLPRNSLILVNDFGAINIDAQLIEYQDERILRLANGCICCTLGGTLAEQLAQAMRMEPRPSALYIEASGVAEPARIADIARVSRQLSLAAVVCLVDASQIDAHASSRYTGTVWRAQIRTADQLHVNRMATDSSRRAGQLAALRVLNPGARLCLEGDQASTPDDRASTALDPTATAPVLAAANRVASRAPTSAAGHAWRSASLNYAGPVDAIQLEALLQQYADVVLRAKGILARGDHARPQVFQLSGSRTSWLPARPTAAGNQLVCIGIGGPRFDALIQQLEALNPTDSPQPVPVR